MGNRQSAIATPPRRNILLTLFLAACTMGVLDAAGYLAGTGPVAGRLPEAIRYALPPALLLAAATHNLGARRGLGLIMLAVGAGLAAEVLGLERGTLFGGRYVYSGSGAAIAGVPVMVPVFWAVFIYAGYSLTNSFLCWLGWPRPARGRLGGAWLPALVLADALAVVAIDLFLDPLLVRGGMWSWVEGGTYFGVPAGNFLGWMVVTAAVTAPFRAWEYLRPRRRPCPRWVHLLPPVSYAVLCLLLSAWSFRERLEDLAAIGAAAMGALVLANLGLFARQSLLRGDLSPRGPGPSEWRQRGEPGEPSEESLSPAM